MTASNGSSKRSLYIKIGILVVALIFGAIAGAEFWELRHFKEVIVTSDALTEVKWFSDYVPSLKNTWMDTPVFIFAQSSLHT